MDWHQLWEITSAPDNVPIVALIGLVPVLHVVRDSAGARE